MISKTATQSPHIQIFGPQALQNELLAAWITKKTRFNCWSCQETDFAKVINQQEKGKLLILWDCMGKGVTTIWMELGTKFGEKNLNCRIALFNVSSQTHTQIEKQAIKRGVYGLFLQNCSRSLLLKGITAILNGELWFSRRIMTEMVLEFQKNDTVLPDLENPLTPREKEILLCILTGASNNQISSDLYISPKTVKSHLYNIYKKINVPNRLQATLWGVKNL